MTRSVTEHFKIDVGRFTVIGPAPLAQIPTCIAGHRCVLSNLQGTGFIPTFDDGVLVSTFSDSLAVLDTCGSRKVLIRAPRDFVATSSTSSGASLSFTTPVTAAAGTYQLLVLLCSGNARAERPNPILRSVRRNEGHCQVGEHFAVGAGSLTLIGPSPHNQDRTCIAGLTRTFAGIMGNLRHVF